MTILNFAVGPQEFAIVTDSRISAAHGTYALPQVRTKVATWPAINLVAAHTGYAMGGVVAELHGMLSFGLLGNDVLSIAERFRTAIPAKLLSEATGRLVLGQMIEERARVLTIESPDWMPQHVPCGAWIQPALRVLDVPLPCVPGDLPPAVLNEPAEAPDFRASLASITWCIKAQLEQNPVSCGEPVILTLLDSGGVIRQQMLRGRE